ncbi:MAG: adenylate kinase family protein [Candidatus Parvarchaeota archaeon]|nr:adenylate kinase family protein [Candidatus Parvarchaeota archaeon]MCW1301667.1 adenylate kinase family protein [Candidatus Parvarchaeota archaeon]
MIIAITGTPGVGKHSVAEKLRLRTGYEVLDVNRLLRKKHIKNISASELNKLVSPLLHQNMIVVSHLAHLLTSKKINLFIVLRCDPRILSRRLKRRGYSAGKIYANTMFETIDGEYIEAIELHRNVIQFDNSSNISRTVDLIAKLIRGGTLRGDSVDYSSYLMQVGKSPRI